MTIIMTRYSCWVACLSCGGGIFAPYSSLPPTTEYHSAQRIRLRGESSSDAQGNHGEERPALWMSKPSEQKSMDDMKRCKKVDLDAIVDFFVCVCVPRRQCLVFTNVYNAGGRDERSVFFFIY
jgi:hypothetical protein